MAFSYYCLTTLRLLCEEYKLLSSSPSSYILLCLLSPDILLSDLLSNTYNSVLPLGVSQQYKVKDEMQTLENIEHAR
jgi:hypothetical protein